MSATPKLAGGTPGPRKCSETTQRGKPCPNFAQKARRSVGATTRRTPNSERRMRVPVGWPRSPRCGRN